VPATSANLGPGFDVLGLALDHHNEVELTAWESSLMPPATIQVDGEGASRLPLDKTNLVYRMAKKVADLSGRKVAALRVKLSNRIPLARGMGSSSAAIVGGLFAANAGLGEPFTQEELLRLAVEEEGHPDNVAPALYGGLCAAVLSNGKVTCVSWRDAELFQHLRAVVCVPYFELATEKARDVVPQQFSRADAVFNASRVALLLGALLNGRHEDLGLGMEDRLHQSYRAGLVPGLADVIVAARKAGAWGAALSGAGPSVLALAPAKKAADAGEAMVETFRKHDVTSLFLDLDISTKGAQLMKGSVTAKKKAGK
jgi:homoserine kinase